MACPNKVTQNVPHGYTYKQVELPCGSTSIYGEPLMCASCEAKIKRGEMLRPGYCKHGRRLYDDHDRDLYCELCEFGDD